MKIEKMNVENRPRDKMIYYGPESLSTEELLAILIETGTKEYSCIELAHNLLSNYESLSLLKNESYQDLIKVKGIKKAKACKIIAAIEFSKRVLEPKKTGIIASNPSLVSSYLISKIGFLEQENIFIIYVNCKGKAIGEYKIVGNHAAKVEFNNRLILENAMKYKAYGIILAHNHPSGEVSPSSSDIERTMELKNCCEALEILLLDHIIVSSNDYYSFLENHIL